MDKTASSKRLVRGELFTETEAFYDTGSSLATHKVILYYNLVSTVFVPNDASKTVPNVRYWLIITNIAVTRFLTSAEQMDYLIVSDSIGDPHTFSPQLHYQFIEKDQQKHITIKYKV